MAKFKYAVEQILDLDFEIEAEDPIEAMEKLEAVLGGDENIPGVNLYSDEDVHYIFDPRQNLH